MHLFEVIFTWLAEHRRDPAYLADLCEVDLDRLTALVCGQAVPTDHELAMLADVTGVPVDDIQRGAETETETRLAVVNPATCYGASEVAELLGTSADTVYGMMSDGRLYWVRVGEKLKRVPHFALVGFLMGYDRDAQRGTWHPSPGHVSPGSQTALPAQGVGVAPDPPGVPPQRDGYDGAAPPPPRLL